MSDEIHLTNGELNALYETIKILKKDEKTGGDYIWTIRLAEDGDVILSQDDSSVSVFDAVGVRRFAYSAVLDDDKFGIGRATEGTLGYTPMPEYDTFGSFEEAQKHADQMNKERGMDPKEAMIIVGRTMRSPRDERKMKCPTCHKGHLVFNAETNLVECEECGVEFELKEA